MKTQLKPIITFIMTSLLIIASIIFWYWLIEQHYFTVGKVIEIIPANGNLSIILLSNWLEQSAIAITHTEATHIHQNQWLLVYGLEFDDSAELLLAESIDSNPVISKIFSLSPTNWLLNASQHSYLSIVLAGVLIIFSKRILILGYILSITSFLTITLWHVVTLATEIGHLNSTDEQLYLLLVIIALFIMTSTYKSEGSHQLLIRFIGTLLTYLYGVTLIKWFGFEFELATLSLYVCVILFPVTIISLIAAYLLSSAIGSSQIGNYGLFIFSLILSIGLFDKNSPRQYRTYLSNRFKRSSPSLDISGKVTLAELFNKQKTAL